jgi:hypothetical protein
VGYTWWIEGEEEGHVLVEFRPALNTETFFETMYGLARDGEVDENGVPPCYRWRSSHSLEHVVRSEDLVYYVEHFLINHLKPVSLNEALDLFRRHLAPPLGLIPSMGWCL